MNLIEQLGGYEEAKFSLSKVSNSCDRGYIEDKGVFYSHAGLKFALLEHRRTNNIYEVGDRIVHKDDDLRELYGVMEVVWLSDMSSDNGFRLAGYIAIHYPHSFRHAEPKEIKADIRL